MQAGSRTERETRCRHPLRGEPRPRVLFHLFSRGCSREKLAGAFQVHLRGAPAACQPGGCGEQGSKGLEGVPGSAPACSPALERRVAA